MQKVLYKSKTGKFKIDYASNICIFGFLVEKNEFVIVLFQLAFTFKKNKKGITYKNI
jgi:hypothetical protein